MPRKDSIHQAIKNALLRDGWTITNDPLVLKYRGDDMFVDLGAERLLGAERGADKIAVEIKSFTGLSNLTQLHNALGQYQMYLAVLEKVDPHRRLYLALGKAVYDDLEQMDTFGLVIQRFDVLLVVVRIDDEEIELWKP